MSDGRWAMPEGLATLRWDERPEAEKLGRWRDAALLVASRCMQAPGPEPRIDARVWSIITRGHAAGSACPPFSSSVDAALSARPQGWQLARLAEAGAHDDRKAGLWVARLIPPQTTIIGVAEGFGEGQGRTAPLALLNAAMRAHASRFDAEAAAAAVFGP